MEEAKQANLPKPGKGNKEKNDPSHRDKTDNGDANTIEELRLVSCKRVRIKR